MIRCWEQRLQRAFSCQPLWDPINFREPMITLFQEWPASNNQWQMGYKGLAVWAQLETILKGHFTPELSFSQVSFWALDTAQLLPTLAFSVSSLPLTLRISSHTNFCMTNSVLELAFQAAQPATLTVLTLDNLPNLSMPCFLFCKTGVRRGITSSAYCEH